MSNQEDFSDDIVNGGDFGGGDRMNSGVDEMYGNGGGHDGSDQMESSNDLGGHQRHYGGGDAGGPGPGKDDDRKLFIGGLSWETTEKDLREYFSKYGGIESLTLKTDPATGRSRGFAFIVFEDPPTLERVIAAGEHLINGKKIDPKKAKARTGKIFVGGLLQETTDEDVRAYFSEHGNVLEIEMPIDKIKNQRKGFCFVTFDNEQVVHELLKHPKQRIGGKEVDVKKAQPSQGSRGMMGFNSMGTPMRGGGGRGGGGMRGSSRGGRGGGSGGGGDWYYGSSTSYAPQAAGYYDYYGGGYGGSAYGSSYDYTGYGGYETGYGYDTTSDYTTSSPRGTSRGRGIGMGGKQRGGTGRGIQRHVPY